MRITKKLAQELIEALDESRGKISREAEEILKKMGQVYNFAEYERRRKKVGEWICDFPMYVKKAASMITIEKTAGRPKKFNLVKRTHLFFLTRVMNKSNRDKEAILGSLLQPFIEDVISYKYVERLYSDEQVEMVLHNVFMLMLHKKGVSGKFAGDGTGYALLIAKHYSTDPKKKGKDYRYVFRLVDLETGLYVESGTGFNGLGGVNFSQGYYRTAEKNFRKALEIDPENPIFYTNLAWALIRQEKNNLAEAENYCKKALEFDSQCARAYECLGVIEFKKDNLRTSEGYLHTSVELDTKKGGYTALGALYAQMSMNEEAEKNLKKALEINNYDTQAHIELGNLFLNLDMRREAFREFHQAIVVDPDNPDSHRALAIALMHIDELEEAEEVLRKAIRLLDGPKKGGLFLILSQLLTKCGDKINDSRFYEEALEEINRAVLENPNLPDLHFHKGVVETKLGDYRAALKSFQSCMNMDKTYFRAEQNIRRIRKFVHEGGLQPRASKWGSIVLLCASVFHLIFLWQLYLTTDKITAEMLMVLVPILLGFFVVAFLLPWLIRIKLPGFEAEMYQITEKTERVSSGPLGEIGFGKPASLITQGPQ